MAERTEFKGRDGNTLAADVVGPPDGPPVLLFHGGGQTRHSWGTTQNTLAETGWRAYSVDLRGHGESAWAADGDYSIDAFAGDVTRIAAELDRPVLVGASLGGMASLTAMGEYPGGDAKLARGLVLVDVAPRIEASGRERIGEFMMEHMESGFASLDEVADAIQRYNPHRPRPKDLSGLRKNLREVHGRLYWHWDPQFISGRSGSFDETRTTMVDPLRMEAAARHITTPALLVRGRVSDLLSEEGAQSFLELVPHARLVDVAGAGHMVAGDRNDLFNDSIVSFLKETR
jgi:pimeloyl-ACP methyl ester carboxylesterase